MKYHEILTKSLTNIYGVIVYLFQDVKGKSLYRSPHPIFAIDWGNSCGFSLKKPSENHRFIHV